MSLLGPDGQPAKENASKDQRKQQGKHEEDTAPKPVEAEHAFLVYKDASSHEVVMTTDLNTPLLPARPPVPDEVYGDCANVMKDLQIQETMVYASERTVARLVEVQQQVQEQMQSIKGNPDIQRAMADLSKNNSRRG